MIITFPFRHHLNMKCQHYQFILRNEFEVIFDKFKLIFPEAGPVTLAVTRIGIQNVVQDHKMYISVIKSIICRPKIPLKSLIRKMILLGIKIHIMISDHVIPRSEEHTSELQ